jgi:hypothetical protein
MNAKPIKFVYVPLILLAIFIGYRCTEVIFDPDIDGSGINDFKKFKSQEPFSQSKDLTTQTILKVEGINGTIHIESVTGIDQISIYGEKIASSKTYAEAKAQLKNISIEIDVSANEIFVKTDHPTFSNGTSYQVNYNIDVPSNLIVNVKNENGDISGNLSKTEDCIVEFNLFNGNIDLKVPANISSKLSARLLNGIISVIDVLELDRVATNNSLQCRFGGGQGEITLKTRNGNITVSGF